MQWALLWPTQHSTTKEMTKWHTKNKGNSCKTRHSGTLANNNNTKWQQVWPILYICDSMPFDSQSIRLTCHSRKQQIHFQWRCQTLFSGEIHQRLLCCTLNGPKLLTLNFFFPFKCFQTWWNFSSTFLVNGNDVLVMAIILIFSIEKFARQENRHFSKTHKNSVLILRNE